MEKTFDLQPAEVDASIAEMEAFNNLVEDIDAIPTEFKEEAAYETTASKLGGPADKTGFGKSD